MAHLEKDFSESTNEFTPLDKLEIEVSSKHGIQTKVSGIHIGFMESRYYVIFRPPPVHDSEKLSPTEEEWLEYMMFIEEDLHWLLKLPYHRFWSQIIYDEDLHLCLESYLSQAPRDYDISNLNLKEDLLNALKKVHKLVFLVYLRMSTHKESKRNHLTPSAFGKMIYDNFILDIPKLMDLCALYGLKNFALLSKMIQNIFSSQPKYMDDLNETSKMILTAFNLLEEKLIDISNRKLHIANENDEEMCTLLQYSDTINYITDICFTLYVFLEICPNSCQIFHQNGVILRLPSFYEQVFSIFEKELSMVTLQNSSKFEDVKSKTALSKTLLVRIFRSILNYAYIQTLLSPKCFDLDKKDEKETIQALAEEGYLEVMLELISYKSFLSDYNLLYPFDEDLVLFNEIGIDLDSKKVNQIFCALLNDENISSETFTSSISNGARPKTGKSSPESASKPVKDLQGLADLLRNKPVESSNSREHELTEKTFIPNPEEMKSLIQSVLDILDGYGEGFIQKCLEHYNFDSEQVINALLSDSLPDDLNCIDKQLKQMDWNFPNEETYSILSERKNVFDNDEFDIFSGHNVNMENVHIGKRNKNPGSYQSLQKDKDSEFLKELTLNYEYDEENESNINIYDDEYDDTYDSAMVGLREPEIDPDEDEEEKESPKTNSDLRDKPQDFCINPEVLRERAEQRRQSKFNQGRYNRGGGSRTGEDERQQKDRRKAQVGNHNRRKQSDFKRSRGMGPVR